MPIPFGHSLAALAAVTGLFCVLPTAYAQRSDAQQLLARIDEHSNYQGDVSATFTLRSFDPTEGDELRKARWFRRDADDAFLLLILEPVTQLGQGYLNVAEGFWFYDPESRQFAFTSLGEAFEGSDANYDDFGASSLAEDYVVAAVREGALAAYDVWILELEASHGNVTYPYKTIWVGKDSELVLKSEDNSLTRRLLRVSYFPSYTRIGDSFVADHMVFVDALVEGRTTEVVISEISAATIPDYVFTKAYVERVSR